MATSSAALGAATARAQDANANSLWRVALRRIFRRRSSIIGMIILGFLTLVAMITIAEDLLQTRIITPFDPNQQFIGDKTIKQRQAPCIHALGCPATQQEHLMGIDANYRDLFSRVIYGARVSLIVGLSTITFAIVIGTILGAIAGYAGGWIDIVIMRVMDVLLAFPSLILAIAIVAVLGPGLINALLAIGIVSIPAYARVVRASVLSMKEEEFVEASRALGGSHFQILFRRILPNSLTPLIVTGTLGIATAILDAAALSFLGLGAQPPTPEWGRMLGDERSQFLAAPHLVVFPGLGIMLTVLAFNLLGDGLRDALDPRLSRSDIGIKKE